MTRQSHKQGVTRARWWALLNHRKDLPVLFARKQDAIDNRDPDEYLVRVEVREVKPKARP